MTRKILLYYLVITFIIFFSLKRIVYSKTFIPKPILNDTLINSIIYIEKFETNKLKPKVFGIEKIFNGTVNKIQIIDQDRYAINNNRRRNSSNLLNWDMEIKNKIYHIHVNRSRKTITIWGEAEDWKEKDNVEHIIELRAPDSFEILNKIKIRNKGLG